MKDTSKDEIEATVRDLVETFDDRSVVHKMYKERLKGIIVQCIMDLTNKLEEDSEVVLEAYVGEWVEQNCRPK